MVSLRNGCAFWQLLPVAGDMRVQFRVSFAGQVLAPGFVADSPSMLDPCKTGSTYTLYLGAF